MTSFLVITAPLFAAPCECPPASLEELKDQAVMIFKGEVSDIQVNRETKKTEILFDVEDHIKGENVSDFRLTDAMAGTSCAIEFKEKDYFEIYARWDWGSYVTSSCSGTKKLERPAVVALGQADAAKEKIYTHLQIMCMGKAGTSCCLDSIKSMRKGYYPPEPENGCPEGTVPDRLTCGKSYTWCVPATEPVRPVKPK